MFRGPWSNRTSPTPSRKALANHGIPAINAGWQIVDSNFLIVFLFLAFSTAIFQKFIHTKTHLSGFRGPWWAAYTRLWLCKTLASGESARLFVDVNKKYGSLARVGPNHLVTDDPELTRQILAVNSKWRRGPWYDALRIHPLKSNIVAERNHERHDMMRYQMSAGYAGKDIHGLEAIVDERITKFIKAVELRWLSTSLGFVSFDIARRVSYLTMDIITHICYGKPVGCVESDADKHNLIATMESRFKLLQHFTVLIFLNTILKWIALVPFFQISVLVSPADTTGFGPVMKISRDTIKDRLTCGLNGRQQPDMLSSFLKRGVNPEQAELEVLVALVAGFDSTATAINSTILAIISSPTVYYRLLRELDAAAKNGKLSAPAKQQEAQALPYLQAIIKEGLRCFPPIAQLRERETPPEGFVTSDGRRIPGGVFVGFNAWGTQLNAVFGDDASAFRPERWLAENYNDSGRRLAEMRKVQELVFGHGSTRCLGINIAMMVMSKALVELFRRYDIQCINYRKPWSSACHFIFFQKEFNVRVTRRALLV